MSAAVAAKKRWQMTRDSAIVCQYDDRITKKLLHTNPILSFHSIHHSSSSPTKEENFWKVYHNRLLVWSQIPIIPLSSGLTFYTFSFHFLQNESVWYFGTRLARIISPQKCVSKYSRLLFLLKRWWLLLVGFLKGTQIDTVAPPLSKSSIIQSTPTEWEWTAISTKKQPQSKCFPLYHILSYFRHVESGTACGPINFSLEFICCVYGFLL